MRIPLGPSVWLTVSFHRSMVPIIIWGSTALVSPLARPYLEGLATRDCIGGHNIVVPTFWKLDTTTLHGTDICPKNKASYYYYTFCTVDI